MLGAKCSGARCFRAKFYVLVIVFSVSVSVTVSVNDTCSC